MLATCRTVPELPWEGELDGTKDGAIIAKLHQSRARMGCPKVVGEVGTSIAIDKAIFIEPKVSSLDVLASLPEDKLLFVGSTIIRHADPTTKGDVGGPKFDAPVVFRLEGLPVVASGPMQKGVNFTTELTRVIASFADDVVGGH